MDIKPLFRKNLTEIAKRRIYYTYAILQLKTSSLTLSIDSAALSAIAAAVALVSQLFFKLSAFHFFPAGLLAGSRLPVFADYLPFLLSHLC